MSPHAWVVPRYGTGHAVRALEGGRLAATVGLVDVWITGGVFLVAYALIASERLDRTLVALLGGLLLIVLGIIDQDEAFAAVDLNVIFLLAGMMVLASALAKTGFFQWLAVRSVRMSRGDPVRLLIILCVVTAGISAFLDNVTTVLRMTPVTLSMARRLGISPLPYLISQILASNIGGTATLIGDSPNILIGSAAGLDFMDFRGERDTRGVAHLRHLPRGHGRGVPRPPPGPG